MVILKMPLPAQTHDPQRGGDRALTRRQDGACDQNLGVLPDAFGKVRRKNANAIKIVHRLSRLGAFSWWRLSLAYSAFLFIVTGQSPA